MQKFSPFRLEFKKIIGQQPEIALDLYAIRSGGENRKSEFLA